MARVADPGNARLALRLGRIVADSLSREARASARSRFRRTGQDGGGQPPALTELDPLDPLVLADPYRWYARLHAGPRLVYNRRRRIWILHRFDDVHAAARAHDALSSAESVTPARSSLRMMIAQDRPDHARVRRLIAPHFTRAEIARRAPGFEALIRDAVQGALARERIDAVESLAAPVTIGVIAEIMGVPPQERARFREWSDRVIVGFSVSRLVDLRRSASVLGATLELHSLFARLFAERRSSPRDDLIGRLVHSSEDGELADDELFWMMVLLLIAGNETTRSLIAGMLLLFAEQPAIYQRLRAEPELIEPAVEEGLRFYSPIQGLYRTTLREYPVGAATIPARERVLLLFGAANRDPGRFERPDRFDLDRDLGEHVAFGTGIHFCLGAHLARLEAKLVLRQLIDRVEAVELDGEPVWNGNPSVRGLASLPVRLRAM